MRMSTNGVPRKTLESQIDRLDKILDGLSNALQEAVTMSVREAVGPVVREALRDALPRAMAESVAPSQDNVASLATRIHKIGAGTRQIGCQAAVALRRLWAQRSLILLLLLIGLGMGWLTSTANPLLAAVAGTVGAVVFTSVVCLRQQLDSVVNKPLEHLSGADSPSGPSSCAEFVGPEQTTG
jgi:hypothetical protein